MATILPFVIRPRALSPAPAPGCAATIIIFPGVRYEHAQDTGTKTPPSVASNGRRGPKHKAH